MLARVFVSRVARTSNIGRDQVERRARMLLEKQIIHMGDAIFEG